jgi:hypothetical protein
MCSKKKYFNGHVRNYFVNQKTKKMVIPTLKQRLIEMGVYKMFIKNYNAYWQPHTELDTITLKRSMREKDREKQKEVLIYRCQSFPWERSPEGYEFWRNIKNKLLNEE